MSKGTKKIKVSKEDVSALSEKLTKFSKELNTTERQLMEALLGDSSVKVIDSKLRAFRDIELLSW